MYVYVAQEPDVESVICQVNIEYVDFSEMPRQCRKDSTFHIIYRPGLKYDRTDTGHRSSEMS